MPLYRIRMADYTHKSNTKKYDKRRMEQQTSTTKQSAVFVCMALLCVEPFIAHSRCIYYSQQLGEDRYLCLGCRFCTHTGCAHVTRQSNRHETAIATQHTQIQWLMNIHTFEEYRRTRIILRVEQTVQCTYELSRWLLAHLWILRGGRAVPASNPLNNVSVGLGLAGASSGMGPVERSPRPRCRFFTVLLTNYYSGPKQAPTVSRTQKPLYSKTIQISKVGPNHYFLELLCNASRVIW